MPDGGVRVTEIQISAWDKYREMQRVAGTRFNDVHVAAPWTGGPRRRHAPVGRCPYAAEHRSVGDFHLVTPVDQAIRDFTHVRAVGAVCPEPLRELSGLGSTGKALAETWTDRVNRDCKYIARFCF